MRFLNTEIDFFLILQPNSQVRDYFCLNNIKRDVIRAFFDVMSTAWFHIFEMEILLYTVERPRSWSQAHYLELTGWLYQRDTTIDLIHFLLGKGNVHFQVRTNV